MDTTVTLTVNGKTETITTSRQRSLLDVLREDLHLTGTKYGCGEGQCGACTVLADGKPLKACITPIHTLHGKAITTIEGLAQGDKLHPVQQAFLDHDVLQCGYCAAGMVLNAAALLDKRPQPTDAQIRDAMNGVICRCCAYPEVVDAVRSAANRQPEVSSHE